METLNITGHTRIAGLLGEDVRHSFSPEMHTSSFERMGEDIVYLSLNVDRDEVPAAIEGMKAMKFIGCNVTIPYKTVVPAYLDDLSDAARLMSSVNTIQFVDGKTIGHNTDGAGFMRNLKENGIDIIGKTITVAGGGGAGSGVFTQAALDGVSKINVFNIKDDFYGQLEEKLGRISEATGSELVLHDLNDRNALRAAVDESVLFLNATKVGAAPLEDECLLPEEFLHEGLVVADTVYLPRQTKLLKMAADHGNKAVNGIGMLLWQAAIAEHIWTGKDMDVPYIRERCF